MQDPDFRSFTSERLTIRRFRRDDAVALAAYRADPEVARYQAWDSCTLDEARAFIDSQQGVAPGTPGVWFQFAFAHRESDQLIGDCGLCCEKSEPRQAQLGFTLAREWQGNGYAREALERVVTYAFDRLALHRVFAITDERNLPAQRLLLRLGFRREGVFREAAWFKGAFASEVHYAALGHEWSVCRPRAVARPG